MAISFSPEKIAAAVPLLAGAMAICFDVGYFWAVGINFFNTFSLTEHLVFAIQALPYAIAILALLALLSACQTRLIEYLENRKKGSSATSRTFRSTIGNWLPYLILLATFVLSTFTQPALFTLMIFAFVATGISLGIAPHYLKMHFGVLLPSIFALGLSFLIGMHFGISYLQGDYAIETLTFKNGKDLGVRLIRSGERGLLYIDTSTRRIQLTRWDEIASIWKKLENSSSPQNEPSQADHEKAR